MGFNGNTGEVRSCRRCELWPSIGAGNENHSSLVFDPVRKAQLNPLPPAGLGQGY